MQTVSFNDVSYRYESMQDMLFENLDLSFSPGWTGIVGANGSGKTTLLQLATGVLVVNRGSVQCPGVALYCPQRTDAPPPAFVELLDAPDPSSYETAGRLGVEHDWLERWTTLSHGERKRAQIATALWRNPLVLAVDEPTNHLDESARALLADALRRYEGIGLLVSHDRALLDELCGHCLFIYDGQAPVMRPGNYSQASAQAERERSHAIDQMHAARKETVRLERETRRRRVEADRSAKRRSKRGIPIHDHDARFKRNLARVSGKDGQSGRLLRQLEGRVEQARRRSAALSVDKRSELGVSVHGAACQRDILLHMPAATLPLGPTRALQVPGFTVAPGERVAITGDNGTGKSTLVRRLVQSCPIPDERLVYVPQELDSHEARNLLEQVRGLPGPVLGRMMTMVSRLGSRPEGLLRTQLPSPGETRKLLLALGMAREPYLIMMDEPTNHMDLPSVQCLEQALADCGCALLLVSHDRRFLRALTDREWRTTAAGPGQWRLTEAIGADDVNP
ncbi:MAG: ATP-binding cassette domain-containing protein [Chitinivibrionales bacterium]|nr:ATP-binding cassette domain-containing protein [Chitinivibrionales bacterium]